MWARWTQANRQFDDRFNAMFDRTPGGSELDRRFRDGIGKVWGWHEVGQGLASGRFKVDIG